MRHSRTCRHGRGTQTTVVTGIITLPTAALPELHPAHLMAAACDATALNSAGTLAVGRLKHSSHCCPATSPPAAAAAPAASIAAAAAPICTVVTAAAAAGSESVTVHQQGEGRHVLTCTHACQLRFQLRRSPPLASPAACAAASLARCHSSTAATAASCSACWNTQRASLGASWPSTLPAWYAASSRSCRTALSPSRPRTEPDDAPAEPAGRQQHKTHAVRSAAEA